MWSGRNRTRNIFLASMILALPAIYLLRHALPLLPMLCLWLFAACLAFSTTRKGTWKVVIYNGSFLLLAFALFEGYEQISDPNRTYGEQYVWTGSYMDGQFFAKPGSIDPTIGYGLNPEERTYEAIKKNIDGTPVYDATYSIDKNGMRKIVSAPKAECTTYFFGDSFTFGVGVNDKETLPNQYSEISGCDALNFGVPGYGPHHMLRLLEIDRPRTIGAPPPSLVVFTALVEHLNRASGRSAGWDDFGPSYDIINGEAKFVGPFHSRDQKPPGLFDRAKDALIFWCRTCGLVQTRLAQRYYYAAPTDEERERMIAIVVKANKMIAQRYHAPFVFVLWDVLQYGATSDADFIEDRLTKAGVRVIRISKVLPQLRDNKYYIVGDVHPRGPAYGMVAKYLNGLYGECAKVSGRSCPVGNK